MEQNLLVRIEALISKETLGGHVVERSFASFDDVYNVLKLRAKDTPWFKDWYRDALKSRSTGKYVSIPKLPEGGVYDHIRRALFTALKKGVADLQHYQQQGKWPVHSKDMVFPGVGRVTLSGDTLIDRNRMGDSILDRDPELACAVQFVDEVDVMPQYGLNAQEQLQEESGFAHSTRSLISERVQHELQILFSAAGLSLGVDFTSKQDVDGLLLTLNTLDFEQEILQYSENVVRNFHLEDSQMLRGARALFELAGNTPPSWDAFGIRLLKAVAWYVVVPEAVERVKRMVEEAVAQSGQAPITGYQMMRRGEVLMTLPRV